MYVLRVRTGSRCIEEGGKKEPFLRANIGNYQTPHLGGHLEEGDGEMEIANIMQDEDGAEKKILSYGEMEKSLGRQRSLRTIQTKKEGRGGRGKKPSCIPKQFSFGRSSGIRTV